MRHDVKRGFGGSEASASDRAGRQHDAPSLLLRTGLMRLALDLSQDEGTTAK